MFGVDGLAKHAKRVDTARAGEPKVKCPFCKCDRDRVVDSRTSQDGCVIRRRRLCEACERRFTTYEKIERIQPRVVKKDGSRVPFDREKIRTGLEKACYKRPVSSDQIDETVSQIETQIYEAFDREVSSQFIGEQIMERLRALDQVAYIRFASVYREFKDVREFVAEAKPMLNREE